MPAIPYSPALQVAIRQWDATFHPKSLMNQNWEEHERISRGNIWVALLRAHYKRVMEVK